MFISQLDILLSRSLFATSQRYKAPLKDTASNNAGLSGEDTGANGDRSMLRKSYDWMIAKHAQVDTQYSADDSAPAGAKATSPPSGNPFIEEQPDFSEVPPNWWERRTNEERVFIYGTSVLSFLGIIYWSDCYYESVRTN